MPVSKAFNLAIKSILSSLACIGGIQRGEREGVFESKVLTNWGGVQKDEIF